VKYIFVLLSLRSVRHHRQCGWLHGFQVDIAGHNATIRQRVFYIVFFLMVLPPFQPSMMFTAEHDIQRKVEVVMAMPAAAVPAALITSFTLPVLRIGYGS
jgi:hypothetical protein